METDSHSSQSESAYSDSARQAAEEGNGVPPLWFRVYFPIERIVIRSLRIAAGLVFAIVALWLFGVVLEVLAQPLASLSLGALLVGLVAGFGGLTVIMIAFIAAFYEAGESNAAAAWRQREKSL